MLKEKVESQLKQSLKAGDQLKLSVFRMLAAAIHNREIEKRTKSGQAKEAELTDEEVVQVIRSELKKRREAAEAYAQAGRVDAGRTEEAEAEVLAALLPEELPDAALNDLISEGQTALGVTSEKEFGKLMGWVMGRVKGQASGHRVAALIRKKFSGS